MLSRDRILNDPLKNVLFALAMPVMMSNLLQSSYDLTDTYFVSLLGTRYLAAMQLIWPIIFLTISLASGLSVGGTALVSQAIGGKDDKKAKIYAGQLLTLSVALSLLIGVIGFFLSSTIAGWMGATGELRSLAGTYLSISFIGMPTVFLFFAFTAIRQAQGDTKTPMKLTIVSVLINVALDPLFIFTFHLGIAGAAWATILSRLVVLLYAFPLMMGSHSGIRLKKKDLLPNWAYLYHMIAVSLPASIGQAMASLGFAILNTFIIGYGEGVMTAFAIGNRISALTFMPAQGYGTALVTVAGQSIGAGDLKRANKAFWESVLWTTVILMSTALGMTIAAEKVVGVFSQDPLVLESAVTYLKLILITLPFFGMFQNLIGLFQGSGHTKYAMMMMTGRLWALRIPMVLIARAFNHLGAEFIWYAMVSSNILIVFFGFSIYLSGKWKEPIVRGGTVVGQ